MIENDKVKPDTLLIQWLDDEGGECPSIEIPVNAKGHLAVAAVTYNKDPNKEHQLTQQSINLRFQMVPHPKKPKLIGIELNEVMYDSENNEFIMPQSFLKLHKPQDI